MTDISRQPDDPGVDEDAKPLSSVMVYTPSLNEKFWRRLGFRTHFIDTCEWDDDVVSGNIYGWARLECGFDFSWLDRIRLLFTGKLRVNYRVVSDKPLGALHAPSCDWRICYPGEARQ